MPASVDKLKIIPYQELLGNYDVVGEIENLAPIIPYQELLGNYDFLMRK